MDQQFRVELDELDEILRGDGNGNPGLVARVRSLEHNQREKVLPMVKEWTSLKDQLKGARMTVIAVGIILVVLGGGLGVAILTTLGKVAAALP